MVARKAVFLDRDGVINRALVRNAKPYAPRSLAEFEILPGVIDAVNHLHAAGYLMFVVTNQPDIGNGLVQASVVDEMHAQLMVAMPIVKIYSCPHRQDAGCACRKPKPGMLIQAKNEYDLQMDSSFMIGDRFGDMEAGISAGCKVIFIDHNYLETPPNIGILRAQDLLQASNHILTQLEYTNDQRE